MRWKTVVVQIVVAALLGLAAPRGSCAQEAASPLARAVELMKNRQYGDAVKILRQDVEGKPEAEVARQLLMLGECCYVTHAYEEARPLLAKALRHLTDENEKTIAEYRLACTHFRLKDYAGAQDKIEAFLGKHPDDSRVGTLLLFKMVMLTGQGAKAEDEVARLHRRIRDARRYDYTTAMEADQILCDFYRRIGQDEKARSLYVSLVHNFKKLIVDLKEKHQPVPSAFEKTHDNAALQLGLIAIERRQPGEAVRWLENVRYDLDSKARAKLLLARIAYERKDIPGAASYLTEGGLVDMVPAGPVKSDMYLLLGLCEKARPDGQAAAVEGFLKKVGPEAKGYLQAQSILGELYLERGLTDYAVKSLTRCLESSDWAPRALKKLADVAIQQANDEPAGAAAHYKRAAGLLSDLFVRYPLSADAKEARPAVELLGTKGVDVSFAAGGDDLAAGWEKVAKEKKGGFEAAQALLSLMRHHFRTTLNEKKQVAKAPHFAACAAVCDRLLDEKAYSGQGFAPEVWQALRGEILFHRATCELASLSPPLQSSSSSFSTPAGQNPERSRTTTRTRTSTIETQEAAPVCLPKADVEQAIAGFALAKALVDKKQLDLVKGVELGLLEAMFKSGRPDVRERAEKRFAELEADYGNDPRFQRLSIGLAEWYATQGRYADAAKQYLGVAERGKELAEDETLKVYFSAGSLYSKAAYELQQKTGNSSYCVYLYPKASIDIGDDLLRSYAPFQRPLKMKWPGGDEGVSALEALEELSHRAQIPFVWSAAAGPSTIATYLAERKLRPKNGQYTIAKALSMILDPERHRVVLDIGLAGGTPTLPKPKRNAEDPDALRDWQVIEIYDQRQEETRYRPLAAPYGSFQQVHGGRSAMLFHVLERVEKVANARIVWAEGIEKQEKLAAEYKAVPGFSASANLSCAQVLTGVLTPRDLRWRVIRREQSTEYYEAARDAFNRARKINPKSSYGERAMFAVALNCYNQKQYDKMTVVLREYLKIFDSPTNQFYHSACFWVGWALEKERKYREACGYYVRAAEERLVLYKPDPGAPPASREGLKKRLAYDTQYALFEHVAGEFKDLSLPDFARWVQRSARVDTRLDKSVADLDTKINRPAFRRVPGFDVLCETLEGLGLSFKVENVDPETAEKAYFRLASAYSKDNQMEQALENADHLAERYPKSARLRDAKKLKVDIYRGLNDYRQVLATLEDLRRTATDEQEKRALANEMAAIYFDLADYPRAAEAFKASLATAKDPAEAATLRAAYARCLFRAGEYPEALTQYSELAKEPAGRVTSLINRLMVFYLKFHADQAVEREFPEDAQRLILSNEKLTDDQRNNLGNADLAKVTWTYYVMALIDLKKGRAEAAIERLKAAANSPDDILAGEAGVRLAQVHMKRNEFEQARAALEYLLISVRSSESSESVVRGTYLLGLCMEKLGRADKALARFQELVERYPQSPYADLAQKHPLYRPKPATEPGK